MGRIVRRFVAISGYDRALALATQAFVALIPLLIVVATAVPALSRDAAVAVARFLGTLSLSPGAEAVARSLVERPSTAQPATLVGAVLLVMSVVGFTRSLQRTFHAAWELPVPGLRGFGYGLLGAAVLVAEVTALVLAAPLLNSVPGAVLITAIARTAPAVLLWWPVLRLLLGGRVGWRALLPGAVVAGVGQSVVMAVSGLYVPAAIDHQVARFGLIGMAFVLVSWLVVLGVLLVLAAVLSAEIAGRDRARSRDRLVSDPTAS